MRCRLHISPLLSVPWIESSLVFLALVWVFSPSHLPSLHEADNAGSTRCTESGTPLVRSRDKQGPHHTIQLATSHMRNPVQTLECGVDGDVIMMEFW